ncbi:MAG: hypothetical protein ACRCXT_06885 [Paraclostridium sp.]
MKRSFLKELGLESEVIDKIMSENGKDIEKYKSDIEDYVSEIKELKSNNVDNLKAIEDAVKAREVELNTEFEEKEKGYKEVIEKADKYDSVFKELEGLKKANSDKEHTQTIEKFFEENKIDFTSSFAKEAIISKFKEKEFKLTDNKFGEDAIGFITELKESNKDAFKAENTKQNGYVYEPKGSNITGNEDLAAQALAAVMGQ